MITKKFEIVMLNQISQIGLKRFSAESYLKTNRFTQETS